MSEPTIADILKDVVITEKARARQKASVERADSRHIIYFTPRSGSSWLTAALAETRKLGFAGEYLNPNFVHSIATAIGANTPETYLDSLIRMQKTPNNVFTMEVTYFHLARFKETGLFLKYFQPKAQSVYLIRENIISQAISLYKAVETNVFHTANADEENLSVSRSFGDYDADKIISWIHHIRVQETGFQNLFSGAGISPLRLSYEYLFGSGHDPVALIADHFGVPADTLPGVPVRAQAHRKLASSSNAEMEQRFRAERPHLVETLEADRRSLLDSVGSVEPVMTAPG